MNKTANYSLTIVIPVYNEEDNITLIPQHYYKLNFLST